MTLRSADPIEIRLLLALHRRCGVALKALGHLAKPRVSATVTFIHTPAWRLEAPADPVLHTERRSAQVARGAPTMSTRTVSCSCSVFSCSSPSALFLFPLFFSTGPDPLPLTVVCSLPSPVSFLLAGSLASYNLERSFTLTQLIHLALWLRV